ncbi:MAG: S9 family peptidase [Candidatus Latescibacterota bacterium]|jgi:dipeptidyl aminopeptidase/acylaminoacyl peptidase
MNALKNRNPGAWALLGVAAVIACALAGTAVAQEPFSVDDLFDLDVATSARISPDGRWIAYTVSKAREVDAEPGGRYTELYVLSTDDGGIRPFVTGEANVGSVRWTPDSKAISFLTKRGEKAKRQVWTIRVDGGEAFQTTQCKSNVITYRWHPSGGEIAYTAVEPKSKREKELDEKGYGFIFYEENLKHRNLYTAGVEDYVVTGDPNRLTDDITVWSMEFNHDGTQIAFAGTEKNLIDFNYMFKNIYLLDPATGGYRKFSSNPGKLGNYSFSPKDDYIAYTAALTINDHAVSQVYVQPVAGGNAVNLTPTDFAGHAYWAGWKDNETVVYMSGEGVWNTLSAVKRKGGDRNVLLHSEKTGVVFNSPSCTADLKQVAFTGSSPTDPQNVYYWKGKGKLLKMTDLNPWLRNRKLGNREVVSYKARDGLAIEGLLNYPVDYQPGKRYPLVVMVHGGPESHHTNNWRTYYSRPVQVLNGRGYFVFLPNYRSSTGYGVDLPQSTLGDAAGKEFDDIADGIQYFVDQNMVDRERVGLGGGSYGGFAAAWFATYYTDLVKAVVMFVGISDLISKRSTTDIPWEELYVHSGKKLEEMWKLSLERSPIYYAHQSETATLIIGGAADTRVHPSQSLEMYRRLKMNDHPAVRLVQYPGEGHGNRKMPGRRDVCLRILRWFDYYVKDGKPIDGPMPPYDISDQYGLDLPEEE